MFLIMPFTHEDLQARRWPFLTMFLMALNEVCLIALNTAMSGTREHIEYLAERVVDYRNTHVDVKDTCGPVHDVPRPPSRQSSRYDRERFNGRVLPLGESAPIGMAEDESDRIASEQ